jgi:predicted aconitase
VESSAIVYFNSVLGIRTERDCVASLFAGLTGKYPAHGFHLDENRLGTIHFKVEEDMTSKLDFGLLGMLAGERSGDGVPVFSGISHPDTEELMELSASLASSGRVTMFHIEGITPEAHDLRAAFGGKEPSETVTITRTDFDAMYDELSDTEGNVDFVCLGCPHYSIYEMQKVAELLKGRRVHNGVTLWICTSPATAMMAGLAGYADTIQNAGAMIMTGPNFCTVAGPGCPGPEYSFSHPEYSVGAIATDAAKQAYYARSNLRARKVFLGSRDQCIDAAVTGQWR